MIRLRFKPATAASNKAASSARWESEWATEEWNIDPLDKMSVADFLAHLTALYGPMYMEPVNYERTTDGRFVPCATHCGGHGATPSWLDQTADPQTNGAELFADSQQRAAAFVSGAAATRRARAA